jgi:xanthine/uracil permease
MHIFALFGATYLSPATSIDWRTALLFFISWQLANFGEVVTSPLWSDQPFLTNADLRSASLLVCGSTTFRESHCC